MLLADRGSIDHIQLSGSPFQVEQNKIIVRLNNQDVISQNDCQLAVTQTDQTQRHPPALHLFNQSGQITHRVDLSENDDVLILAASLASQIERQKPEIFSKKSAFEEPTNNVISMKSFLQAKHLPQQMSVEDNLDDVLTDGGLSRFNKLQNLDSNHAWQVNELMLPYFLRHMTQVKFIFTRLFVASNILQGHTSDIAALNLEGHLLSIYSKGSVGILDFSAVAQAWVINYSGNGRSIPALEIYDKRGNCMAIFLPEKRPYGFMCDDWSEMLYSFPRAGQSVGI
ncbi:MAG: hypothetical protein JJ858_18225 [Rhizobiaceae bacterium]|nr:hypothetical protein [Rhizobiaceae bacterium]